MLNGGGWEAGERLKTAKKEKKQRVTQQKKIRRYNVVQSFSKWLKKKKKRL